eukprot:gene5069-7074_t
MSDSVDEIPDVSTLPTLSVSVTSNNQTTGGDTNISKQSNDEPQPRVVTLEFSSLNRNEKEKKLVLILDVLETINLEEVAELLFHHYLKDYRHEELHEHLWRFEKSRSELFDDYDEDEDDDDLAYDIQIPILSSDMVAANPFFDSKNKFRCQIEVGTEMKFCYDEGDPTIMHVRVKQIFPLPDGITIDLFPRKVALPPPLVVVQSKKRNVAEVYRLLTIPMDEAYPLLSKRIFKERGQNFPVKWSIGRCCTADKEWSQILGGGFPSEMIVDGKKVFPSSVFTLSCCVAFDDIDEALYCFEKGIEKQTSPGFPYSTSSNKVRTQNGEIVETINEFKQIQIPVFPYPLFVPTKKYQSEYDSTFERNERHGFNFSLPVDWRTSAPNFSFANQFPKCTKWITSTGMINYWMYFERGELFAMKGKCGKTESVICNTSVHNTLHDAFVEMENILHLPKSMLK